MTIDEAADSLNAALRDAEEAIRALEWHVAADVPLFDRPDSPRLGFGKIEQEWRLFYDPGSGGVSRITSVSREYRVCAAHRLPALLEALRAEHERQRGELVHAIGAVEQFAKGIKR